MDKTSKVIDRFSKYLHDWEEVYAEHGRLRNRLPIIGLFYEEVTSRKLTKIINEYEAFLDTIKEQ